MADDQPTVDDAEQLFELPAGDFVAARDDLVRRLEADGDGDEGDRIKAMRRPTLAAWAVNQVVRRHPDDYAQLVEAGRALQQAMRKAMSGVAASGIREATATRRVMVDALTDRAASILAESGSRPDGHLDDVAATLEAASADPDIAEQVGRGCLSAPLRPSTDFGGGQSLLAVTPAVDETADEEDGIDPELAEQRRAAMRALEAGTSRAEKSAAAAGDARNEATAAIERANEARTAATEARRKAEQAEAEADELAAAAERAERRAEEAAATAERDAEAAEQAREALQDLG